MKTTRTLLLAGMALFCCSIANAQIIYSNNFTLGTGVNISNTPPTFAATYAGGISSAVWLDTVGSFAAHNPLLDNGVNTSTTPFSYWALPFTPQAGHVYLLAVNLAFTNNPGVAPEFGFHVLYQTNYGGDERFNGTLKGFDWMGPLEANGNPQFFASGTSITIASANGIFAPGPSTNTYQMLLDTRSNAWVAAGCINGLGLGSFTYTANPTGIKSVGIPG